MINESSITRPLSHEASSSPHYNSFRASGTTQGNSHQEKTVELANFGLPATGREIKSELNFKKG